LQFKLCQRFDTFAEPRRLGLAVPEVRTTFGGSSVVPDVSFYTWDQLPLDRNGELLDESPHAPAITIEVTSPGQSIRTLVERCQWYVEQGVRVSLLVQLRRRIVTAFRAGVAPRELRGQDRIDLDEVLPGFELTVAELFNALRPR
jgi:Uma2 family endonuclease